MKSPSPQLASASTSTSLASLQDMGPPSHTAQHHDKKYDRQLRIWGAHGQQRLETCRIALLHATATGTEALKNLVLGGIASYTVVDDARVAPPDLGCNFLLAPDSLGQLRAQVACELLQELNESVAGSYIDESPENLIRTNPAFFSQFTVVVATQVGRGEGLDLRGRPAHGGRARRACSAAPCQPCAWLHACLHHAAASAVCAHAAGRRAGCSAGAGTRAHTHAPLPPPRTQMREAELLKLDEICRPAGVTLVAVRSYGLMGLLRVRGKSAGRGRAAKLRSPATRMLPCRARATQQGHAGHRAAAPTLAARSHAPASMHTCPPSRPPPWHAHPLACVHAHTQPSVPEHCVVESKPDSMVEDLRCACVGSVHRPVRLGARAPKRLREQEEKMRPTRHPAKLTL